MAPDYDLSTLHADQADLWMYVQVDAILAEILADQPERRTSPLALGAAQHCGPRFACEAAGSNQKPRTESRLIGVGLGKNKVN